MKQIATGKMETYLISELSVLETKPVISAWVRRSTAHGILPEVCLVDDGESESGHFGEE